MKNQTIPKINTASINDFSDLISELSRIYGITEHRPADCDCLRSSFEDEDREMENIFVAEPLH